MKKNKILVLGLVLTGLILSACSGNNVTPDASSAPSGDDSSIVVENSYTITWKNFDGSVLEVDENVKEGVVPTYDGAAPTKAEDEDFTYTFSGWEPEVVAASENKEYVAKFEGAEKHTFMSVTEAVALANQVGETGTEVKQYVTGRVKSVTNSTYGEMYITDGQSELYIYGVYSSDGALKYSELEVKPFANDEVFLYGFVKTYNGNPEMGASWLKKMISHQGEVDIKDYTQVSILNARKAAKESKVLVQGVVAKITYANGKVPNGVYLVDDTSSIYVYNPDVAGRVEVGEEIQVAGVRDDYILEGEIANAQKYGYQGSIQISDAIYVKSLGKNKDPFKSWIKESSMKELMETPLTNNITTEIYKVTAIVNKVPGSGFVNYYIDDLDNETGSYVYTLCNGSDFAYLDAFDGKICSVYVSVHNAKSTNSGIVYRLIPIDVKEIKDFSMSDENIAKFALEYYAAKQFKKEYNSDPELELLTKVNNDYIPFTDVAISYANKNNSELVSFDTAGGKNVMHLADGNGEVTLTLIATYKGKTATLDVSFIVLNIELPETISIEDAIDTAGGTVVTVRGVVMSSLVNQTGFYINDGTGVIAVRTSKDTISNIAIGNEIVIQGTRKYIVKDGSKNVGQSCIDDATLIANLMGNHDYDKSIFITDQTFEEIFAYKSLYATTDMTTTVFVAKCRLRKNASAYSTNYYLNNGDTSKEYYLYAGSGSQYADFDAFSDGRELTVEFMLCDWNTKNEYRACIISATDGTTSVLNTLNFK